jgi:hypothetical protein
VLQAYVARLELEAAAATPAERLINLLFIE